MLKPKLIVLISFIVFTNASAQYSNQQYREDFDFFWKTVKENYSYWNKKQTNWDKVKQIYSPAVDTITTRKSFVSVIETALDEIYDHHASLNTNNTESRRLVPSGADIWAEYVNGKPTIIELREDYGAEKCGLKVGMEIFSVNEQPIESAVNFFLPKSLKRADVEAKNFALRLVLAGNH